MNLPVKLETQHGAHSKSLWHQAVLQDCLGLTFIQYQSINWVITNMYHFNGKSEYYIHTMPHWKIIKIA